MPAIRFRLIDFILAMTLSLLVWHSTLHKSQLHCSGVIQEFSRTPEDIQGQQDIFQE